MPTQKKTNHGDKLAEMYERSVLDCIVEVAVAVSHDFSNRPEEFEAVAPTIADALTKLQSNLGFEENFPDNRIRSMLYQPIFGTSDGLGDRNDNSPFQSMRLKVISSAVGFSENAQPTNYDMHRERIRSALRPFKEHMEDVTGASFDKTDSRTDSIFTSAASILRGSTITGIYGISGPINQNWPLTSTDPKGARLIENITTLLQGISTGLISREKFRTMLRIAEKGANSIKFILDGKFENDPDILDQLTAQLYAWGSELGIIRQSTNTG